MPTDRYEYRVLAYDDDDDVPSTEPAYHTPWQDKTAALLAAQAEQAHWEAHPDDEYGNLGYDRFVLERREIEPERFALTRLDLQLAANSYAKLAPQEAAS